MKTPIEQIIDFATEHETLCHQSVTKTKDKNLKKNIEAAAAAFRLVKLEARKLDKAEKEKPKIIML